MSSHHLQNLFGMAWTAPFANPTYQSWLKTVSGSSPAASSPWSAASAPWATNWLLPMQQWMAAQYQICEILMNSSQTILLRFMLAPAWMGYDPWVRKEWHDMTAEKGRAAFDSMRGATLAATWPWTNRSASRIVKAAMLPYESKTRANAKRLGGKAIQRATGGLAGSTRTRGSSGR